MDGGLPTMGSGGQTAWLWPNAPQLLLARKSLFKHGHINQWFSAEGPKLALKAVKESSSRILGKIYN